MSRPSRKPETLLVDGRPFRLIAARAPAPPREREEDRALEYLARLGRVVVEPVEGGFKVTIAAGSVCGPTLEEALIGAVKKEMDP